MPVSFFSLCQSRLLIITADVMGLRASKILSALCGVSYYATHIRPEKIFRRSQFVSEVLILNSESILQYRSDPFKHHISFCMLAVEALGLVLDLSSGSTSFFRDLLPSL